MDFLDVLKLLEENAFKLEVEGEKESAPPPPPPPPCFGETDWYAVTAFSCLAKNLSA